MRRENDNLNEEDTEETIRCVRRNGLADDVFYRRV